MILNLLTNHEFKLTFNISTMKTKITSFLFLFLTTLSWTQSLESVSQRYFLSDYNAPATDIYPTFGGGFVVVGTVEYDQNNTIPFVMLCDSIGQQIWSKPYSTFNNSFAFNRVIQLPDSSFVVVGKMLNPLQNDFGAACLRLDKNGNELWKKSLGDNSGDIFSANDVIFTSDSSLLIAGTVKNKSAFLMKLDLDGLKIWSKNFYYEGDLPIDFQELTALKEKEDGHFVAVGTTNYGGETYRGYVFETDENGNLVWLKRFNEPSVFNDVIIATDGLLIRCFAQSANLIKTDFSGDFIWGKRYFDEDQEFYVFPKLTKFSDGDFGLCGAGFSSGSFVKINSSGAVQFDASIFGKSNMMVENTNHKVSVLNNGPVYGVKQVGLFDKHFAVAIIDSLDNNLDFLSESCLWDINPQIQNGSFTNYDDTLLTSSELMVYDAMMELFSSSFEQEEACVIFLGDVSEQTRASFQLYPNPSSSNLTVRTDTFLGKEFQVYDQQGRLLKTGILSQSITSIDISALKSGIYFLKSGLEVASFIKE